MSKKPMPAYDEEIDSTNKSSEDEIQVIPPEVKQDKETEVEKNKETNEDKETEKKKEKAVSQKMKASKSPGTPRGNMARLMGAARAPFGHCIKSTTSDASQPRISQGNGSTSKDETEMVLVDSKSIDKTDPGSSEKPRPSLVDKARSVACFMGPKSPRPSSARDEETVSDAHVQSGLPARSRPSSARDEEAVSDAHVQSGLPPRSSTDVNATAEDVVPSLAMLNATAEADVEELQLATVIGELKEAVVNLTNAINTAFAKDSLEPLYKEREELTKFVLAIGGLTTVASFSSPPGGLDANGFIRFRDMPCYLVYLVLSNAGFVTTYFNLAQLHKPVDEEADKADTLRRRLKFGWFFLWLVISLFFGTFTAGFWLVYPGKQAGVPSSVHSIWPRWFVLVLSISKVVAAVLYVFGKKLVSYCF